MKLRKERVNTVSTYHNRLVCGGEGNSILVWWGLPDDVNQLSQC